MVIPGVNKVREEFAYKFINDRFIGEKGRRTLELAPATFEADRDYILGEVNEDYVKRELAWYESQSLNVNDIPGGPPEVWKRAATPEGFINSNYGWVVFSKENGSQYQNALRELERDPDSRRAVMIYTRPSMHVDQNTGGMQDFMCTNTVQYFIRNGLLVTHVSMRSNDAYFGYRNDRAWQKHVTSKLAADLSVPVGATYWTVGSLHFYERHFYLVEAYASKNRTKITASEHAELFPDSQWRVK